MLVPEKKYQGEERPVTDNKMMMIVVVVVVIVVVIIIIIIIGWIFRKWDVGVWTGSIWLRIGTGGGNL